MGAENLAQIITDLAPIGMGLGQMIQAGSLARKAKDIQPADEDPEIRGLYEDIRKKADSYYSGSSMSFVENLISQSNASQINAFAQNSDSGTGLAGMLMSTAQSSDLFGNMLAAAEQKGQYYTGLSSSILDKISQRKLELDMYDYATMLAKSADAKKSGVQNFLGGILMLGEDIGQAVAGSGAGLKNKDTASGLIEGSSGGAAAGASAMESSGGASGAAMGLNPELAGMMLLGG
jgi:hypothetical protein